MSTTTRRGFVAITAGLGLAGALSAVSAPLARAATNNSEIGFDYFVNKGLTRVQSAGLIGNFVVESGSDPINPAAVQYGGGPGRGIAQWEGARRDALYAYASQRGLPWYNLGLQLDFVWKELTSTESYALSKIRATATVRDAAVAVRVYYERPSVANDSARISAALSIYDRYAGNVEGTNPGPETSFPTVRSGSTGNAVKSLQYFLRSRGYSLTVDGSFGPATYSAVTSFQRAAGLGVDGVVGPNTWAAVLRVVQYGSTGEAVKGLQTQLRAHGYTAIVVDGSFGSATQSTVVSYQRTVGLSADGVVGPLTWGSLID